MLSYISSELARLTGQRVAMLILGFLDSLRSRRLLQDGGSLVEAPFMHRAWLYLPNMHSENLEDQQVH